MAKLTVSKTTDFSGLPLLQTDAIEFVNGPGTTAVATFSGVQLGSPRVSPQALIDGSAGSNAIVVNGTGTPVNLSGWQFMDWGALDSILIRGNSLSETLTGSSQNDTIMGLGGSDTIDGGAGDDVIEGGPVNRQAERRQRNRHAELSGVHFGRDRESRKRSCQWR